MPKLPYYLKPKTKVAASVSLKKFNWDVINPNNISKPSIWVKYQADELASEDIYKQVSDNFSLPPTKTMQAKVVKKTIDLKVLELNQAQNILIFKRFLLKNSENSSIEQIKDSILACDLSNEISEGIIQCFPKKNAIQKLHEMKKNGVELTEAEDFVAILGDIGNLKSRLEVMNFKQNFASMMGKLETDTNVATKACNEIRTSQNFATILQLVLIVGNYLNSSSTSVPAFGFQMSSLSRLSDIKDSSNNLTLLHYLVDIIKRKLHGLLSLAKEMPHIGHASRVDIDNIGKEINQITKSFNGLKSNLVNYDKEFQLPNDQFIEKMGDFAVECKHQLSLLEEKKSQMESSYKAIVEYFSIDTNNYPMRALFKDVNIFINQFQKACKDSVKVPRPVLTEQKQISPALSNAVSPQIQKEKQQPQSKNNKSCKQYDLTDENIKLICRDVKVVLSKKENG